MTAQELHIDLDIDLQKINTNATRNIEPREKDWLLNRETIKFLNGKTRDISNVKRKGLEEDTKMLKDVEPLIRTKDIDVEIINDERGRFILPSFIYKYIAVDSILYYDCTGSNQQSKIKLRRVYELPVENVTDYDENITIAIQGNPTIIFNPSNLPSNYIGDELIYLIKALTIAFRKQNDSALFKDNNIEIYYEWFHETYKENTFFIVGGGSLSNVSVGSTEIVGTPLHLPVRVSPDTDNPKEITSPSRIVSNERVNWLLKSNLSKSLAESPLCTFNKHFGYVYFPKDIIIKQVTLHYICKPHLIDILLSQSLNLDADTCSEIVSRTARVIKALFDSDNYEKYLNEINLIE